jgi:hypothetical protein
MLRRLESPLPEHGEIGRGHNRGNNVTSGSRRGNSPSYAIRRLKRDRPDLAEGARKLLTMSLALVIAGLTRSFRVICEIFTDEEIKL